MELEGYSWPICSKQPRLSYRCRQQDRPSTSFVINLLWRNPEFGTKFPREVPLFLAVPKFPYNTVGQVESSLYAKNQFD